jgi:hypothetical protein
MAWCLLKHRDNFTFLPSYEMAVDIDRLCIYIKWFNSNEIEVDIDRLCIHIKWFNSNEIEVDIDRLCIYIKWFNSNEIAVDIDRLCTYIKWFNSNESAVDIDRLCTALNCCKLTNRIDGDRFLHYKTGYWRIATRRRHMNSDRRTNGLYVSLSVCMYCMYAACSCPSSPLSVPTT